MLSMFSDMQEICGAVGTPVASIMLRTVSKVRGRVDPPAPKVTDMYSGSSAARWRQDASKLSCCLSFLGGKNSKLSWGLLMFDMVQAPACGWQPPAGPNPEPVFLLVAIMFRLVRSFDLYTDVVGLLGVELGQAHAHALQVQTGNLFVEVLGQHVVLVLVAFAVLEQLDLRQRLVGERVRHHEARMTRGATQVHQAA